MGSPISIRGGMLRRRWRLLRSSKILWRHVSRMAIHPTAKKLMGRIAESRRSIAPQHTKTVRWNPEHYNEYQPQRIHQQDLYTFDPYNEDDAYAYEPPYCVPQEDDLYDNVMRQDPYYHNDIDYDIITQPNYMLLDPEENPMDSYNNDHDLYASGYKTRSNGEQRDRTRWDPKSHRAMKPSRPARRNITFADDEEYIEPPQSQQSQGIQAVNTPTQDESSTVQQAGPSNIQQSVPVQSTSPQRPAPNQSTQRSTPTNQQSASTRRTIPEVRSTSTVPRRATQVETRDTEMSEATPTTRVTQATQAGVSHTKPKKKRVPREKPIIDYDVVDDVMNRVANITVQDLVVE
ncbi:hypothetical protein O0I10_012982 [Lichtheimia ornata]|uniref:Uncharacterized protein n=1 Tax=Lichtheimia ornata TaxID=688661 RepID=A0AAD7URQ8_9FUNG|nr:uncharacterized protein O0I10_012982 [Lichtheimia ornata]KAJ8651464.1 hypothetical protein O0I10_012982 [Lichtheimia ornata]